MLHTSRESTSHARSGAFRIRRKVRKALVSFLGRFGAPQAKQEPEKASPDNSDGWGPVRTAQPSLQTHLPWELCSVPWGQGGAAGSLRSSQGWAKSTLPAFQKLTVGPWGLRLQLLQNHATPRDADSAGLGRCPRVCMSHKLLSGAVLACLGTPLGKPLCPRWGPKLRMPKSHVGPASGDSDLVNQPYIGVDACIWTAFLGF